MANPSEQTQPAFRMEEITAGAGVLSPRPRSLYISVAGTMTITNEDTSTAAITVVAGTTIPIQAYKITAATATVFGLYY